MFKKKAKECIEELKDYRRDILEIFFRGEKLSDFQRGYMYGLRVAIVVIGRIFKIKQCYKSFGKVGDVNIQER